MQELKSYRTLWSVDVVYVRVLAGLLGKELNGLVLRHTYSGISVLAECKGKDSV